MMVSEAFDLQTFSCTNCVHAGIKVNTRNYDDFKFEGKKEGSNMSALKCD